MWNNRNLGESLLQIYFCFLFFCILNHISFNNYYFCNILIILRYTLEQKKKILWSHVFLKSYVMVVTREETRCLKRSISSSDYLTSSGSGFPQFASQLQDLCCQLEDLHFLCPSTVECAAISTIQRNDLRMFHNCRSTYPSGMKQNSLHLIYKP